MNNLPGIGKLALETAIKVVSIVAGEEVLKHLSKKGIDTAFEGGGQGQVSGLAFDDYKDSPRLERPAGYICIFQNVDQSKLFKFVIARHPATDIAKELRQTAIDIKVVSIIESGDALAFCNRLKSHFAKRSKDEVWYKLSLSDRRSIDKLRATDLNS